MSCRKFLLSSHTKSSICTNSSRCVATLIKRWEMSTISRVEKISIVMIMLTMLNVKKSLSSLIRIKIMIDSLLVHDLKFLNLNSNRIFERSLNSYLKNQMNSLNCYNYEKSNHYSRNCRQLRKMNLNNFVREMNVHDKNDSSSENFDESKKV
jgi:hypothetical protein